MKTIQSFLLEISNSDELQQEFKQVTEKGASAIESFFKNHDCEASIEDICSVLSHDMELSDEELNQAAGGGIWNSIKRIFQKAFDDYYDSVFVIR